MSDGRAIEEQALSEEGAPMKIGELAEQSNRTIRTLHFYEELGLLTPARRTKGGFRLYNRHALLRIHWISRLQELGFTLPEIQAFFQGLTEQPSAPAMMSELRAFYDRKLQETVAAITRLQALERELQGSLDYLDSCRACAPQTERGSCRACQDPSHVGQEPPPLVAALHEPAPNPSACCK